MVPHKALSDTQIFTMVGPGGPAGANIRVPNLNITQKAPIKTVADFKLRTGVVPIRRMDVSDAAEMINDNSVKKPSFHQESQALAVATNRNLPPHLLLASLLEELCYIYVKDSNKAQHLFKILCERLSKLQVMAPLSHLDEMSGLRYQRRTMLNKLIRAAMISMEQGPSLRALPDAKFSLNLSRPGITEENIIEQQTSRYMNEFQELGILGKGGFGSVFKARNYLDGREYAVKKVRFKHKNTDLELKLLREVKALANLQHTNIVGYNAAWMEYDSPYLMGKAERSPIKGQKTQDSDSDTTDSVQFDNQDSMSIEFCLSDEKSKAEVKESSAVPIPGGLAMNAKLFSTVHKPDMAHLPGRKAAGYLNSRHTRLNENHNRSSEEDSVVFVDSFRKHGGLQKSPTLELEPAHVKKGTNKSFLITKNKHDTNVFPKDVRSQENSETVYYYEERFNISTEAYTGASTNMFPADSWDSYNVGESLLGNSSSIPQFHQVSFEDGHSNSDAAKFLTSNDVVNAHRQNDSAGCVMTQEISCTMSSLSVDDQISVVNTSQVHCHWCPHFTKCSEQKYSDQNSGVQLSSNFVCRCQHAAASVVIDLKQERYLHHHHHHQENVSLANLDSDSCVPADRHHYVLNSALQSQNLQVNPTPSRWLISERETPHNSQRTISTPFQTGSASVTPKFSVSPSLYNNKTINVNSDKTIFTEKKVRHGPVLSYSFPPGEHPVSVVHEIKRDLNIVVSNASSIDEPLSKTSNVTTSPEKSSRQAAVLGRRGPLRKGSFRNDSESDTEEVFESQANYVFQNSITLYIQMELCTFTLQEWLSERNSQFQLQGNDDVAMHSDNIRVFHQILQGVDFIHANGLIHRDLKPRNIFLSGSNLHVKIGDFGLATGDALKPGQEDLVLTPLSSVVTPLVFDSHTEGVGTSAYASPEQLNGSNYDFRSDMYSLGVMLYEMFHVFATEMERAQEIQQLRRENKCSTTFRKKWPLVADIVEALTNPVASLRPSAQDVLSSKLFLSHEQQIKMLQRNLLQQQKQVERLQRELQEKDRIIAQLRRDQREKTLAEEFDLFL